MGLAIAGERSGVGKTTVTLAMLAALRSQGYSVQSFKVGPDYIDPMFHSFVTGRSCRNLDSVLTSQSYIQACFARHTQAVDCAVVEGVMGLFDGVGGTSQASTAEVAKLLDLPVLLVIDCSKLSASVAAIAFGYRSFDLNLHLAGIVLNKVGSDRHLEFLKTALAPLNIPILGIIRRQDSVTIPDRHLGLIPTAELPQLHRIIDQLTQLGLTCFDWEQLYPLLQQKFLPDVGVERTHIPCRIAIAQDSAFNFYYPDNLDILQQFGAELIPWSPLKDTHLPNAIQGLYLGGGFPEVFAEQLSTNQPMRDAIKTAILTKMPIYAECGGLMYLSQAITTFEGKTFPMVGVLPTQAMMSQRLTLGYRKAIALQSSPIIAQGETLNGHEFHRSQLTVAPSEPLFELQPYHTTASQRGGEGWKQHQIHASYLHLHWGETPHLPQRFLQNCTKFALG